MRTLCTFSVVCLVLFALCACSSVPPKIETVYVKVPVPVSCVKEMPTKPTFVVDQVRGDESLGEITDAYMVDRHQRIIYETRLEALLVGCTKQ